MSMKTPAAIARAALDGIAAHQSSLDMNWWFHPGPTATAVLTPTEEPICGTVMCAAGWVAHAAGWDLIRAQKIMLVDTIDGGMEKVEVYAVKDRRAYPIWEAASEALGVSSADAPWWSNEEEALDFLRAIADGHA